MDIKQYSQKVIKFIDNLTDEEFDQLLINTGIEECPFEDEIMTDTISMSLKGTYKRLGTYSCDNRSNNFDIDLKVA